MRAIDFFCGAGGLTRGLLDAGVLVVAGFDMDERCKETYERNNRPAKFYQEDISRVDPPTIGKFLGSRRKTDLLLAGCAPCQPFSQHKNGNHTGAEGNARRTERDSKLLGAFARLVEAIQPGQVLIENVPGLTRVQGFSTYRRFVRMLGTSGYNISEWVLDAKDFGVPQTRRRYVLIAIRGRSATPPAPTFGPGLADHPTRERRHLSLPSNPGRGTPSPRTKPRSCSSIGDQS